jgi:glutamine amidotransferase
MCRLTAYKGKFLLIGDLVTKPDNSLIMQARDAAYHPGVVDKTHRRNILVNGDGFGVAWYGNDANRGSCCFKFVTPAWSNSNLRSIGDHVPSSLIFAHIRAASSGHDPNERVAVSLENCHPFVYKQFTFMHNGGISMFSRIKLALLNRLAPTFFYEMKGSTDSEHIFALFLTFLTKPYRKNRTATTTEDEEETAFPTHFTIEEIAHSINLTVSMILDLCQEAEIEEACSLNLCVTDGVNIVATRFRNGPQSPPSLYYYFGNEFVCEKGNFYAKGRQAANSIVISSAPLSKVCVDNTIGDTASCDTPHIANEHDQGAWVLMPKDHMLICRGDERNPTIVNSIALQPIVHIHADTGYPVRKNNSSSVGQSIAEATAAAAVAFTGKPKVIRFRSKL